MILRPGKPTARNVHDAKRAGQIRQPRLELGLHLPLDDLLNQSDRDTSLLLACLSRMTASTYSLAKDLTTSGWTSMGIVESGMIVASSRAEAAIGC